MPLEHRSYRLALLFAFIGVAFIHSLCIVTYLLSSGVDLLLVIWWTLINLSYFILSPIM